jgi:hypothetical protein
LFQEDLKDDDHQLVIATCGRILHVAQLLGQQRTRNELIPFLLEYVEQDADEAHTVLAKHLGDFTDVRDTQQPQHHQQEDVSMTVDDGRTHLCMFVCVVVVC